MRDTYITNPTGCLLPEHLKFLYYAGHIRALHLHSDDFSGPSLLYRLFLERPRTLLFPNLRSIFWVAKQANVTATALRTLFTVCRSSRVTEFTLTMDAIPPYAYEKFGVGVVRTLKWVGEAAPGIRILTIIGHHNVVLPATCLDLFSSLGYVNLQIGMQGMLFHLKHSAKPSRNRLLNVEPLLDWDSGPSDVDAGHRLPYLETLLISWSPQTDLSFLAHTFQFSHLRHLTITADNHPPQLLDQINSFAIGRHTFPSLTDLSISCGILLPQVIDGMDFGTLIDPFLSSTLMQNVCIQFPGFCMGFSTQDLDNMVEAWPALRSLDISFFPSVTYPAPDLHRVIERTYAFCPHLHSLHVPALATYTDTYQRFTLNPPRLHPHFRFSSDVFVPQHHPLDVALEIFRIFPSYMPILPFFVVGMHWSVIEACIQGLQEGRIGSLESFQFSQWNIRCVNLQVYILI